MEACFPVTRIPYRLPPRMLVGDASKATKDLTGRNGRPISFPSYHLLGAGVFVVSRAAGVLRLDAGCETWWCDDSERSRLCGQCRSITCYQDVSLRVPIITDRIYVSGGTDPLLQLEVAHGSDVQGEFSNLVCNKGSATAVQDSIQP